MEVIFHLLGSGTRWKRFFVFLGVALDGGDFFIFLRVALDGGDFSSSCEWH
jgi:hypothetical protein